MGSSPSSIRSGTPAAISAINLSLLVVAIVVPVNVMFGVLIAPALVRGSFPGSGRCLADPAVGEGETVYVRVTRIPDLPMV